MTKFNVWVDNRGSDEDFNEVLVNTKAQSTCRVGEHDANATYVRNPCVIIDRFSSVENLNFSHSRKLIGMVVQTTNASTAVVVGPRGEIIADVICEEYVVKLRQSHNKKQIFYMLPDDKHSVYGFDRTWGFSKWLGCAFETKIRTVQLYVSIQKRSPSSDKATCEDALRNAQARSSYENQDRSYDAYHGHPVIINIHKYETYVPDFGQLRGSDMQFLFLGQNLDNWHYEPGVSIRTASYDFRKLPLGQPYIR
uniref:Uncharacterized protein n=1 Tax=Romanomermis culicivorax TaxID=13658 RepID=A0A915KWZ0_ROMCU